MDLDPHTFRRDYMARLANLTVNRTPIIRNFSMGALSSIHVRLLSPNAALLPREQGDWGTSETRTTPASGEAVTPPYACVSVRISRAQHLATQSAASWDAAQGDLRRCPYTSTSRRSVAIMRRNLLTSPQIRGPLSRACE